VVAFNTFVGAGSRIARFGSDKPFDPSDITISNGCGSCEGVYGVGMTPPR
jgi:hypothetical protein